MTLMWTAEYETKNIVFAEVGMSLINIAKYVVFCNCDCTLLTLNVHVSGLIVHDDRDEGPMCLTVYSANLT